jgi:hypothetical protein
LKIIGVPDDFLHEALALKLFNLCPLTDAPGKKSMEALHDFLYKLLACMEAEAPLILKIQ